ncbi:Putative drug/sodium antiporter, partial [Candidatus Arthromitus sp. SFB-4]
PLIFGIDGIWFSVIAAEIVAVLITVLFIIGKRSKYRYL